MQQSSNISQALFHRLWIIVLGLILGGVLGAFVSQQMTPIYRSSVYLLVVPASGNAGTSTANDYAQAYSKLATDPAVIGSAVDESGVGVDPWDIKRVVGVEVSPRAPILQITASSRDPDDASTLANALGSGLSSFTEEREEDTGYRADVMAEAVPSEKPALPDWTLNIGVGAVAGLLVGGMIALLWDSFRETLSAWAHRRWMRKMEKEKQRQAKREEEERQQREKELADLEKIVERYLELRSDDPRESR